MSADIWLESADGDRLAVNRGENFNVTYNLTPMLLEAGMGHWREYIGMTAKEAGERWEATIDRLDSDPEKFKKLNPSNGWGSYEYLLEVMSLLVDACESHPKAIIGGWL